MLQKCLNSAHVTRPVVGVRFASAITKSGAKLQVPDDPVSGGLSLPCARARPSKNTLLTQKVDAPAASRLGRGVRARARAHAHPPTPSRSSRLSRAMAPGLTVRWWWRWWWWWRERE